MGVWTEAAHRVHARPLQTSLDRLSKSLRTAVTSKRTMSQVLIVVQNSVLVAVMHRSRTSSTGSDRRYFASTAILLVEIIKFLVSISLVAYTSTKALPASPPSEIARHVCRNICSASAWLLVIPAALFTLQNFLIYIAIGNMQAIAFQVTYQLKILTTVFFSILLLGRTLSSRQWLAMVLLTLGVVIVQMSQHGSTSSFPSLTGIRDWAISAFQNPVGAAVEVRRHISALSSSSTSNTSKGLLAVVAASITSGLSSVYFEKLVKQSSPSVSLWTRNAQLAFFSLFPAAFGGVLWQDGAAIARDGFFVGYSPLVWAVIGLQALGGLLVAMCVAYADNIAKNFAASLSIVVSCAVGSILFAEPVTPHAAFGISTVLFATHLYQSRSDKTVDTPILPLSKERESDDAIDRRR